MIKTIIAMSVMKREEAERERNENQEKQVMLNTIAHLPLTDGQTFPEK